MTNRHSLLRSSGPFLGSFAVLALVAACGEPATDPLANSTGGAGSSGSGTGGSAAGKGGAGGSAGSAAAAGGTAGSGVGGSGVGGSGVGGSGVGGTSGAGVGGAGVGGSGVGGTVASGGVGGSAGGVGGAGGMGALGGSGGAPPAGGAGGTGGAAGGAGGSGSVGLPGYNPDFKEDSGTACTLPEPAMLATGDHHLPDPFLKPDGSRITKISDWTCQRAWLKKQVEAFVHGTKPPTPTTVTGTVTSTGVNIHVEEGGKTADFMIPISLPGSGSGPVPAVFQADGSGVPASFLKGEGVAAMAYSHSTAESAFGKIYSNAAVSPQIKWAWSVSRAIDVMVAERDAGRNSIIDPTALGTTGCSYAGKSAFTVGAFDERIALGMPMESGTGGLASYRVVGDNDKGPNGGEGPEQLNEACAKWFSSKFCSAAVDKVPADANTMVAMYAPRGLAPLDNNRIGHLAPVASFAADQAGAEVFKALGILTHIGYHGGNDDDPHDHCSWNMSQQDTARKAIQGFLTKKIAPANFFEPKLKDANDNPVAFDLKKYVTWTTPTLE